MKNLFLSSLGLILVGFHSAVPGPTFTKKSMGANWPFRTIQSGTVSCVEGAYVVFVASNGKTYALNGSAGSVAKQRGWNKLDGEQIVGKDISPILNEGKKLCQ